MYIDEIEIKRKTSEIKNKIEKVYTTSKINEMNNRLCEIEKNISSQDFWQQDNTDKILRESKILKNKIEEYNSILQAVEDIQVMLDLLKDDSDENTEKEILYLINDIEDKAELIYVENLLSAEYDMSPAIVTIHSGAGGTESQDYVCMLLRMYEKWCERQNLTLEIYDVLEGEEAGYKSVTFRITGDYAYGLMKCEKGVHRLVRISPFDAGKRRHTSFAAVEVIPEIDDNIQIEINPEDIEIDTFRASGAGGQHINKTDSAVRIKHIKTGIVVTCQNERSQIQNKETCMKMLKSKLYEYEKSIQEEKMQDIKGNLAANAFGSQIRSYVLCPYTLVKDHRTGYEVGNAQSVLDGDITQFMIEYLKYINN